MSIKYSVKKIPLSSKERSILLTKPNGTSSQPLINLKNGVMTPFIQE
ncbi:hypothetical protein K9L16_01085 [Candidatus Pacearchaeota archaeon]|nr:hypothetical protein [Candidatus Pacearchaeota archaeon]